MRLLSSLCLFLRLVSSAEAFGAVQLLTSRRATVLGIGGDYLSSLSGAVPNIVAPALPPASPAAAAGGLTLVASDGPIVFWHARKSWFAVDLLTPSGPRKGADVGRPHDSSRELVELDLSSSSSSGISVGSWWCAAGGWPSPKLRPSTEVFMVFSGRGCVTDRDGKKHFFGPGDTVVLPKYWSGRWDVLEDVHKVFFIHEHPDVVPVTSSSSQVSIAGFNDILDYRGDNSGFERNKPNLFLVGGPGTMEPHRASNSVLQKGAEVAHPTDGPVRALVVPYPDLASWHRLVPDSPLPNGDASPSTASQTIYRVGSTAAGACLIEVGSYPVHQNSGTECFHVLEGIFILTNSDGGGQRCGAGDTIVLPQGWTGHWDVVQATRTLKVVVV